MRWDVPSSDQKLGEKYWRLDFIIMLCVKTSILRHPQKIVVLNLSRNLINNVGRSECDKIATTQAM